MIAASPAADALAAQVEARRLRWVDLAEGVRLRYAVPSQFAAVRVMRAMAGGDGDRLIELLAPLVREWDGVAETMLLGAGVGGGDAAPCTPRLWAAVAADRPDWVVTMARDLTDAAAQLLAAAGAAQGN